MLPALLLLLASTTPLAIRVEVQPLGRGQVGSVVGIMVQLAPEDRPRVGERLWLEVALVKDGVVVDKGASLVNLQPDGSVLLYREWPAGAGEVRVQVADESGEARGAWAGPVVVTVPAEPFAAPEGAPPEAVALAGAVPAGEVAVRFLPPARAGGLGAVQLEVETGAGVARVEFFQDEVPLVQRNRPPWTVSVNLGEVARRTVVRAVARGADGRVLGEDALVLNAAPGQVPVEVLLGAEAGEGGRLVTVSVPPTAQVDEVTLFLDEATVARWTACPCAVRVPEEAISRARVLTAEVRRGGSVTGQAVRMLGGGRFVDAVTVEQVELPVVVVDTRGSPVTGLAREDFEVAEDGVSVSLSGFATSSDLPLAVGIVVDVSGSMKDPFPAVRQAVTAFANNLLQPGDRFFLMSFAFEPVLRLDWTQEASRLEPALAQLEPEGGTSLHDAVVRSLERFRSERSRKAVVLLTDGEDTTSRTGWDVALRYARTMRTPVFPIGFRISVLDFVVRQRLKELAEQTGGEAFLAPAVGDLAAVYRRIGAQLRSQYLLSYRSPATDGGDRFRRVTVTVKREGLTARTIAGYLPVR